MKNKYHRTLYIPGICGQSTVWKRDIVGYCNTADTIISFGNLIGCNDYVADTINDGHNHSVLNMTYLYQMYFDDFVQLIGPNEIAALCSPKTWTNTKSVRHLQSQWLETEGIFKVAEERHGRLVTHAGLTKGQWDSIDKPDTAREAADRLNEKFSGTLYQGPALRLGNGPVYDANPIWADPVEEVYPSWVMSTEPCPFDQVHASGSLNSEYGRASISSDVSPLRHVDKPSLRPFGSTVLIKNALFQSVHIGLDGEVLKRIPKTQSLLIERHPKTSEKAD